MIYLSHMVMLIFLKPNNYIESREYLEGLIKDYKADFDRFINDDSEEDVDYHFQLRLNEIFDSIPSQLARETDTLKFKYSYVKKAVELPNLKNHLSGLKRKASIMKIKKILL